MAQLLIAGAGAAVGFAIGGPVGAQIGWAAGSVVGSVIAAPDVQGPRLADRTVQVSSYGAPISLAYGGVRLAGTVIWSTDLQESSSESSAKGGPSVTTYSYSVSCAVAIARGPVASLRRIWADAKLVYDAREDADAETVAASADFAEYFTFYTGSETQLPDPTIEAVEGADNVEAYRGVCYVVFTDLPLGPYGNRVPSFSFEISTEPQETATLEGLVPYVVSPWTLDGNGAPVHSGGATVYDDLQFFPGDLSAADTLAGSHASFASALAAAQAEWGAEWQHLLAWGNSVQQMPNIFAGGATIADEAEYFYIYVGREPLAFVLDLNTLAGGGQYARTFAAGGVLPEHPDNYALAGTATLMRVMWSSGSWDQRGAMRLVWSTAVETPPTGWTALEQAVDGYQPAYPLLDPGPPPSGYYPSVVNSPTLRIRVKRTPYVAAQACEVGDPAVLGIAQLPDNANICVSRDGVLSTNWQYTEVSGTFKQLKQVTYASGALAFNGLGPVLRNTDPNYNSSAYWTAAAAAAGLSGSYGVDWPVAVTDAGAAEADVPQVAAGSILLSEIVTDLCTSAGMAEADIDVDDLASTVVRGYVVGRVATARQALEPLRQVYQFDAVESGAVVRFVLRGGAAGFTLDADDLGAGFETAGEPMEHTRQQQTELPREVVVAYQSVEADYQAGTQQSQRRVGGSEQTVNLEVPIVLTDQRAAELADALLYLSWVERVRHRFSLTVEHSAIEPTDVVNIDDGERSYRVRVVDKVQQGTLLSFEAVDDDAAAYTVNSTAGSTESSSSAGISRAALTNLQPLDLPILREADDASASGYYVAASGYGVRWPGCRVFRSADGGTTYADVVDVEAVATMGYAETVLGSYSGGNIVDELSTLRVTLNAGTLATVTRDQLLQGANLAALGDEVLQFQRATLVSGTTYDLTGFLRGRRGTEQHLATHAVGDRFVLLDAATITRVPSGLAQVGQAAVLKGVTFGSSLAAAYERDFTNTGAGVKPLAPVQLAAGYTGTSGSYAVRWVRRSRIPHEWADYIDAPLGEATEAYLVELLRAGVLQSSQTVTSPSATVTSAQAGDVVRVRQVSATVGPGFEATVTIA